MVSPRPFPVLSRHHTTYRWEGQNFTVVASRRIAPEHELKLLTH